VEAPASLKLYSGSVAAPWQGLERGMGHMT
jgi:hypothetical protein